ncbi:MAG: hypothetical protein KJO29_07385 [Bacteroidia bacterium]|nr:hypothetical protein [Bacteroidia bacterium]
MKNFFVVFCCLIALNTIAQSVPFNINYQAMARDADGVPLQNAEIEATINILKGDPGGAIVFSEKHYTRTNTFGIYFIVIGDGEGQDNLKNVEWAQSDYFIETMIIIDGGQELINVSKLNSVPYAFLSYKSVIDETEDEDSDITNEIQTISLNGTHLSISEGNEIDLSSLLDAETTTSIALSVDGTSIDYKDENGVTTNLNLCNVVDNCETVTSITYNSGTKQLSYIDENGNTKEIKFDGANGGETLTALSYDSDNNRLEYIDENGELNVISLGLVNPTGGISETVSTLENHGDGSFTYTAESGTQTFYEETTTSIRLNNNRTSIDYIDEDRVTTNLDLCHVVDNCETVTSLVEISNGILVYTDENGAQSTLELNSYKEDDPDDSSKSIVYAAISGPEQAIFERGTGQLINGERYIQFSDHFKKLLAGNTMTVSLTPHSANTYGLAVVEKNKEGIRVKELMNGVSTFSFDWEVKATRKSELSYQVIRGK